MPRVTKSVTAKTRHKKVLKATKGHYGARSRLFKTAKQSNIKSLQYAFRDRKNRKRDFRSLWIARINAGSRELGVSYSKLINSLSRKNIILDRKILSDLAVSDNTAFKRVVEKAIHN
jgi:large subunit ribosomal protein L20